MIKKLMDILAWIFCLPLWSYPENKQEDIPSRQRHYHLSKDDLSS